ncbi:MAG: sulfite exporter TauE/SafE family protein [Clostridiales bacterium]|nr:sulfite exporter TauE/SafE family protein [Clostridiales bacterium]
MEHALLPVAGFLIGIVAAMTGVGGGIFIVPLLTIAYGFIPQHAVGTSLGSIIFTALAATYSYARQKRIFYRLGLLMAVATVPGAYLGAYMTTIASPRLLGLIFGVFLFFMALRMIFNDLGQPAETAAASLSRPLKSDADYIGSFLTLVWVFGLGFLAGFASGFLGIGGGVLAVPVMNFSLHMPIHYATATSMFMMIFTSLSGAAKHTLAHHLNWGYAFLLALGTIFGAQVGAGISRKVSGPTLRRIFGVVMLVVSVQMVLKFL